MRGELLGSINAAAMMLHPFVVPLGLYDTGTICFPMIAAVSHPAVHVVKFPHYFAYDFDVVVAPMDFMLVVLDAEILEVIHATHVEPSLRGAQELSGVGSFPSLQMFSIACRDFHGRGLHLI